MIAIRGSSVIVDWLLPMLLGERVVWMGRHSENVIFYADRYFFCQGLLRAKPADEQTEAEVAEGMAVNASQIIAACDAILAANERARICVMGSESGFSGYYDGTYAAAKDVMKLI